MEQRTLEWYNARLGYFTASSIADLFVSGKGTKDHPVMFGLTAQAVIREKAAERCFSKKFLQDDVFMEWWYRYNNASSKIMEFGTLQEPKARTAYQEATGLLVKEVGFMTSCDVDWLGASPDGEVVDGELVGGIEIKNLTPHETMRVALAMSADPLALKAANKDHFWQTQTQMSVCGYKFVDYVVYCEILENPLFIWRQYPVAEAQAEIIERVTEANKLADEYQKELADKAYKGV